VTTLERPDTAIHDELDVDGPPAQSIQGVGVISAGRRDLSTLCAFDNALMQPTTVEAMADDALVLLDTLGTAGPDADPAAFAERLAPLCVKRAQASSNRFARIRG
jgi:hypothetical protein